MKYEIVLSLGLIFLISLVISGILRRFKVPSITSYIILGIMLGPLGLNIIDRSLLSNADIISTVVLSIIAFILGQNFSKENFSKMGRDLIYVSFFESLGAVVLVTAGVYILTRDIFFSLALASISAATSPTSVIMTVRELNAKGKFAEMLMGTVALDDLWSLIIFALILALIRNAAYPIRIIASLGAGSIEIAGSLILGVVMGWGLSVVSKMIKSTAELLILTLGFIFFNAGVALVLNLSAILSSLAMSAAVINISPESFKFFNSVRTVDSPLYLLFFVLAGAKLELTMISTLGLVGAVYIISRMAGKIAGVYAGGLFVRVPSNIKANLGIALAPQAGVNMGLAIVMASACPDEATGRVILSIIVGTTIIFELFGPLLTRHALIRSMASEHI